MSEFWTWYEEYAEPRLTTDKKRIDRRFTFRKIFEHLDQFKNPIIIETGCTDYRDAQMDWVGAGCSTILFDKYVSFNGGKFISVDIDEDRVSKLKPLLSDSTTIHAMDSVEFLKNYQTSPDLVYLDSAELDWNLEIESQVHHLNEFRAILPKLTPQTLLVVDDSPALLDEKICYEIRGKGGLIAKYANELGVPLVFTEYQTGWLGFPGFIKEDVESSEAIIARARILVEQERLVEAYPLYKKMLARNAEFQRSGRKRIMYGEACVFLARLALKHGRIGVAYDWYIESLKADPRAIDYRLELISKVLVPMKANVAARAEAYRAINIEPGYAKVWRILGAVESEIGDDPKSVLKAYRKSVEVDNRSSFSLLALLGILCDTEQYDEAEEVCEELVARNDEELGEVFHFVAMLKARRGLHEEAVEFYKKAIEIGTHDESLVQFHLSLSLHSIGRLKEGFEALSKRINNTSEVALMMPMKRFAKPLFKWQEPPAIVHLHSESGDGDNFALIRYLPLLVKKGYTVRYEARDNFLKLAKDSLIGIEVTTAALDYPGTLGIKDFNYHLPIGELPYLFGTEVDTIPWDGPYIRPDPEEVKKYEQYRGKIGIAWSAGVRVTLGIWTKRYGQLKSLSYDMIKPIIRTDPGRFVSLQAGRPTKENDGMIENVIPEDASWDVTAAIIENLDLVITPDTGLAHLAGAMGKPCWVMMHGYNSGWHFMCERPGAPWNTKSPWYPNTKVIRQKTPGDWPSVIKSVTTELRREQRKVA